ncbi:hypothetical protein KJM57_003909 [Salmonella enterica]|nr:hypothetical protein [Salmonella enterica]EIF7269131.1 hypothetical protein [Salmonella enterica]EIG0369072.1 hypothetical protein [Salmonella enterica]
MMKKRAQNPLFGAFSLSYCELTEQLPPVIVEISKNKIIKIKTLNNVV